jgi:hypothetical protein
MRRSRYVPADPARTSAATVEAIGELVAGALPAAGSAGIATAIEALRPFAAYLIPGEHLASMPATLVAGSLTCDIYTLHGEDATEAEEPNAPPGAAGETEWTLYVPAPSGAPFEAKDIEAADPHFSPGPAPADAATKSSEASVSLADLVDADALRAAEGA